MSSPLLVDTGPIRTLLRELAVEVSSVEDLPTAGEMPTPDVLARIQNSSFLLGVLASNGSGAVLFEVGIAKGLGKPVFLIVDDRSQLISSLLSLPLVVAPLTEIESLRFHLEAFLANLTLPRKPTPSVRKPARFYGGGEPIPLASLEMAKDGLAIEQRVARAFALVGASVTVSTKIGEDAEADMIVWLPEADFAVGGPLPVEIKATATETFPDSGIQQIGRILKESHLRTGMLVTNSPQKGVTARVYQGAFLYSLSLTELERLAKEKALIRELKRARNKLAHGAS